MREGMWDTARRKLLAILYVCFGINIFLVLICCITDTQNNLPVSKMILLPFVVIAVLLLGVWGMQRWKLLQRGLAAGKSFSVFLAIYTAFLFVLSMYSRTIPDSDHLSVYQGALHLAGLSEESNWLYFARYENNIPAMLLLAGLIRLNTFLKLPEPYMLAVALNSLQVAAAMWCVYQLLRELVSEKYRVTLSWTGALLLGFFLPVISHNQATYTDAMSFCGSILGFYLWYRAGQRCGKKKIWYCILAGICWGVGAAIKLTVMISFIAVFCYIFFCDSWKKNWKYYLLTGLVIAAVLSLANGAGRLLPSWEMRSAYKVPFSYWIALGLQGNGGYTDNEAFCIALTAISDQEQRVQYSNTFLKENAGAFADFSHIIAKVRHNFASGNLGSSDFMRNTEREHLIFQCISTSGKYFWRYSMIMASLFYSFLWLIFAAAADRLRQLWQKKKQQEVWVVTIFSIIGLMIYLMIFEANNRQLYNHLAWFVLGACIGLDGILKRKGLFLPVTLQNKNRN